MKRSLIINGLVLSLALASVQAPDALASAPGGGEEFTDEFRIEDLHFASRGRNPYFPLIPGSRRLLQGTDDGEHIRLLISTLYDTEKVDGVDTRVVEEREWVDGELVEVSRNFFAHCKENGSVFYFGEDVDIYEDGEIVSHEGAWRAGKHGARAGVIMPGLVTVGSRYFQEVAPAVALDRAEHITLEEFVKTPAGAFANCLFVEETSPLDRPGATSEKFYAPGIGLIQDGAVKLIALHRGGQDEEGGDGGDCDDD
jgi:hypothetical protein